MVEGIIVQDALSKYDDNHGNQRCSYYTPDKLRCVVGQLFPEEFLQKMVDMKVDTYAVNASIGSLFERARKNTAGHREEATLMINYLETEYNLIGEGQDLAFLLEMQSMHDNSNTVTGFLRLCRDYARRKGLEYKFTENEEARII